MCMPHNKGTVVYLTEIFAFLYRAVLYRRTCRVRVEGTAGGCTKLSLTNLNYYLCEPPHKQEPI